MSSADLRGRPEAESAPTAETPVAWIADADGDVEYFGAAYLNDVGLLATNVAAWQWYSAIHPYNSRPAAQAWREALATGTTFRRVYRLRRAGGTYRGPRGPRGAAAGPGRARHPPGRDQHGR